MCQSIDHIDRRRSQKASYRARWLKIYTACRQHAAVTIWYCRRDGSGGHFRTGNAPCVTLSTNLWPAAVVALAAELKGPKRKRKAPPKVSAVERREAKAAADLARWQRRLKLAQGKVKKCKARVRYYERQREKNKQAPPQWAIGLSQKLMSASPSPKEIV